MKDDLDERLRDIHADIPEPRTNLTEEEKDELIRRVGGPRTTASILKAAATLGKNRIPFIFNKIDSQAVLEILANDMEAALERARGVTPADDSSKT